MDRVLARFPSPALKLDVLQGSALPRRSGRFAKASFSQPDTLVLDVDDEERARLNGLGAVLYEDVQFRVLPGHDDEEQSDERFASWSGTSALDAADAFTLHDVLNEIRAPEAWRVTSGRSVTVAVVDTGIADGLREVEAARRSPLNLNTTFSGQHWVDSQGHGSMCAAVAAGSTRAGGRYNGVAPEANVLAARSTLSSTDLLDIYDELFRLRKQNQLNGPLVVTNSYGLYTCTAPHLLPEDHPFISGVLTLIDDGVFVCFAAGNNHYAECNFDPTQCGPNTIWGANSHDRVVSVGTVSRSLTNCDPATPHASSSRGPGEWARAFPKPDCVAPTYGEVPWGASYRKMAWWGTSGACPQVAGLAALILSVAPTLTPATVADIVRKSCSRLPEGKTCVGAGVIDCIAAVQAAALVVPTV